MFSNLNKNKLFY